MVIKINQGASVKITSSGKLVCNTSSTQPVPSGPQEIPLILPGFKYFTPEETSTFNNSQPIPIFDALVYQALPHVVTSGILKGLTITATNTLSSHFRASTLTTADIITNYPSSGPTENFYYHPTYGWMSGFRQVTVMKYINPLGTFGITTKANSTLNVLYKWPVNQWE